MGFRITMLKSAIVGLLFALHATDAVEKTSGHPVMNRLSRLMSHHRRLCPFKTYCPGVSDGQGGCTKCDATFHLTRRRRLCPYKTGCTDLLSMQETSGHRVMNRLQRCERVTSSRLISPHRRLCMHQDNCPGKCDAEGDCDVCDSGDIIFNANGIQEVDR